MIELLPHYYINQLPDYVIDVVFIIGGIYTIFFIKGLLSLLLNLIIATVLIISATCVFTVSAKQKLLHIEGYYKISEIVLAAYQFIVNNFISFVVSVDKKVEFVSDDFYWNGIFNYKTYNQINNLA